jgi:WD repeat-containing protein 19
VQFVGMMKLPYGQVPLLLHNGEITLQTASGKVISLTLDTHNFPDHSQNLSPEQLQACVQRCIALKR